MPSSNVENASSLAPPARRLRSQKSVDILRPLSVLLPFVNGTKTIAEPKDLQSHHAHPSMAIPSHASSRSISQPPNLLKPLPTPSPAGSPQASPNLQARSRSGSLVPPPPFELGASSRPSSPSAADSDSRISKRRSWLPGSRSRNTSKDLGQPQTSRAWIIAGQQRVEYNHTLLCNSEKVPELWNDDGDTLVHLFPQNCQKGPSFRVSSTVMASSHSLVAMVHGMVSSPPLRPRSRTLETRPAFGREAVRKSSLPFRPTPPGTPPRTPSINIDNSSVSDSLDSITGSDDATQEHHLYFPLNLSADGVMGRLSDEDVESLIQARNLFAFLTGQPLVATPKHSSIFAIFLAISILISRFEFSNLDQSTFGEAVSTSFNFYLEEFHLQDVSKSREKTIEALVLSERMRSAELYNEAFAHAVGKYKAMEALCSPYFDFISSNTRQRLDRAYMDLQHRIHTAELRLKDFDYPSMFTGLASSTSSDESRMVSFKDWRSNFNAFRKWVIGYYKHQYGSWPPKAANKKNTFSEDGLNRLVLRQLYSDFSGLYDVLVDRKSETTRTMEDDGPSIGVDPTAAILRRILGEFDRSMPPVQPPIPFDVPLLPSMLTVEPTYYSLSPSDAVKVAHRRLKDHETKLVLTKAANLDIKSEFVQAFQEYETKEARGKSVTELANQRCGVWLFLYAVLQSLPMLVVDAPGLRFVDNVEYFLCEVSRGQPPWMEDANGPGQVKMSWYGVTGGSGVVALPSDVVEHGVEGIYRRSHCWDVAKEWVAALDAHRPPPSPTPGPGMTEGPPSSNSSVHGHSRNGSLSVDMAARGRSERRSSVMLGLEQLPVPSGFGPPEQMRAPSPLGVHSRSHSRAGSQLPEVEIPSHAGRGVSPGPARLGPSTFDDILSDMSHAEPKKKKERKLW